MIEGPHGIYIAWNVFEDYATSGSLILKEMVLHALNRLLPGKTLSVNLPAQGIATLQDQREKNRLVNHLLYASPVRRGERTEIIEDLLPLYDIEVSVRAPKSVKKVYLAPQMEELSWELRDGAVCYRVPKLECHQMVVLDYEK